MGLYLVDLYRSPNIGIFLRTNDKSVLIPKGVATSKSNKVAEHLGVVPCFISVQGTRLLGPLIAMNNKGVLVSRMIEDYEVKEIASQTGLVTERLKSKYTAVGNLVSANDNGAIVSPILEPAAIAQVKEVLGVTEVHRMALKDYTQVGALVVATNRGAAVYPKLTEQEVGEIGGDPGSRTLSHLHQRWGPVPFFGPRGQFCERNHREPYHGPRAGIPHKSPEGLIGDPYF